MKFRLEADTTDELREKSTELLKSLYDELVDVAPEVADRLAKALPRKERELKYPVLRDLEKQTSAEYDHTLKRMLADIGKVLARGPVAKSEETFDEGMSHNLEEALLDAGWVEITDELAKSVSHKYIRRVPYTGPDGKKRYRYYYRESAAARAAREGELVRVGEKLIKVVKIEDSGDIVLQEGENEPYRVSANAWADTLAEHYGDKFYLHAEKRARQAISAVLRHVPGKLLSDLRGDTDEARMADLESRVPEVYDRLQATFQRAGVNPFQAKQILGATLKRKGWESDARALVIGAVLTPEGAKLVKRYRQVLGAAENLAGGARVEPQHAAMAIDLVQANVPEIAKRAERELGKLQKALQEAWDYPENLEHKAAVLAQTMASTAIQKLQALATAFPSLADRAISVVRDTMLEVPSVAPAPPKQEGAVASVRVAGEGGQPKALKAKYKLVESGEVTPSHDPTSFRANKKYPKNVQERAYHRDKAEQMKVVRNAGKLDPAFVINTNPDAVNGPPLVTDEGIVLGGNSRTMSMQLAYSKDEAKAAEMKQYLVNHAHEFGLSKADVEVMDQPILIREVEVENKTTENLQVLVRQMNESFTQGMDPRTMQVALGRRLDDAALQSLAKNMEEGETLNHFLGTARSDSFMGALRRAGVIDDRNVNQFVKRGTKRLNSDGKVLVARILAGRVLADADLLSDTSPKLVESVAGAVPFMVQASGSGEGYDLSASVKIALDAYNKLQDRVDAGAMKPLDAKITEREIQQIMENQFNDLFGEVHPILADPRAQAMLELFIRRPGPKQMRNVFKEYARLAMANPEGQEQLLGEKMVPDQVFRLSIQAAIDKEAKAEAAEVTKKKQVGTGEMFKAAGPYIGPRGGKWADPQHTIPWKPEKKRETWKVIEIIDTREIDPDTGKRIPESGNPRTCDRCGKDHKVYYHLKSESGKKAVVGSGCGPKLAGGAELIDKASLKAAKDKVREQERKVAQERADRWVSEMWEKLDLLQTPKMIMTQEVPPYPRAGYEDVSYPMLRTDDGVAQMAMNDTGKLPYDYREQTMAQVEYTWVGTKLREAIKDFEVPEKSKVFKWGLPFGEKRRHAQVNLRVYIEDELRRRMRKKFGNKISHVDNLELRMDKATDQTVPLLNDHTQTMHDKNEHAYTRVKQVLAGKGYKDSDFGESGPFYGWSVNQLIDFARDKRAD